VPVPVEKIDTTHATAKHNELLSDFIVGSFFNSSFSSLVDKIFCHNALFPRRAIGKLETIYCMHYLPHGKSVTGKNNLNALCLNRVVI
jgi:hypothetical protein